MSFAHTHLLLAAHTQKKAPNKQVEYSHVLPLLLPPTHVPSSRLARAFTCCPPSIHTLRHAWDS